MAPGPSWSLMANKRLWAALGGSSHFQHSILGNKSQTSFSALPTTSNTPNHFWVQTSPWWLVCSVQRIQCYLDEWHEPQALFFFGALFFFIPRLPSHPAQTSACRSSALYFHQVLSFHLPDPPLPSLLLRQASSAVWLSFNSAFSPTSRECQGLTLGFGGFLWFFQGFLNNKPNFRSNVIFYRD